MKGSQKSLKSCFPSLASRPEKGPRGTQGAQKVGGSAPHIYILVEISLVNKTPTFRIIEKFSF